jgi:c(7)-type cytochrome triheme protein
LARRRRLHARALALPVGLLVILVALVALAVPARLRIPRLAPHPSGAPAAAALFSHARHAPLPCYACHPSVFPEAPLGFTHHEMQQGLYCGACHNGVEASAIETMACQACHVEP